ncbi:hypothetical protein FRC05_003814 [Tulasnella sp. 425]|nr:hypothetical protein FRC05_003814 [Tulasnella sp. 425]
MVVTRSKTLIDHKEPGHDKVASQDGPGNGAGTRGSPDDEYQPKPKRKMAKTTRTARASGGSRHRLREDRFTSLPLDVIYEILSFLTPLDLLRLARTNKALRNHLMSKRSRCVWKAARAVVVPPVPICPKGMSEPQLAVLLFARECTVCSKPITGTQNAWWTLHLRACNPCFKSTAVLGRVAAQQYAYLEDFRTVLELLPGENMFVRSQRRPDPRDDYYLSEDVRRMSEIVEHHQFRLEARVEGTSTDFEQFVEKTKSEICEQMDPARVLMEWGKKAEHVKRRMKNEMKETRRREVVSKLVELGHDVRDAQQASSAFLSVRPLTSTVWKRIQPKAEILARKENLVRTEMEETPIRKARKMAFGQRYSDFKSSYNAHPDTLMPPTAFLMTIEGVEEVLEAEGTDVSPSIFDQVFSDLSNHVDEWRNERKLELTRFVLKAQLEEAAEEQGILFPATSIFATCGREESLAHDEDTVHWIDTIGDHFTRKVYHTPPRKPTSSFEEMQCIRVVGDWVGHAKLLVEVVGLDSNTATITDMDNLDARFYCDDCSLVKMPGEVVARNWRNCASVRPSDQFLDF